MSLDGEVQREASIKAESELADLVERLDRLREGRRACHVHLSKLRAYNRREHHLRIAANSFEGLLKLHRGNLFRLNNDDLIFVCEGATVSQIDDVILKLRFLFSDDPLANDEDLENEGIGEDGEPYQFCTWYDIKRDYPAFRDMAERMLALAKRAVDEESKRKRLIATGQEVKKEPLDPARLAILENALVKMDIRPFLRRQPICAVVGEGAPEAVFDEYFVSVPDLAKVLLPTVDVTSDRWLFAHFTMHLDRRMFAAMPDMDKERGTAVSLNVNVSSLLSSDFLTFDQKFRAVTKRQAVFELQAWDMFADMGSYVFARDFLHDKGYRVLLDGLNHLTFPLLPRDLLKVDLMKITWSPDIMSESHVQRRELFEKAIKKANPGRVILCRVDSHDAIQFGRSQGISLYQGRYIDKRLEAVIQAKREAARKARQAGSVIAEEQRRIDDETRRRNPFLGAQT